MADEEQVCFVCATPDPPLVQACGCKSARVHRECLIESMARVPAHRTGCPVCGRAYPTRARTRLGCSSRGPALMLLCAFVSVVAWLQYVQLPREGRACLGPLCLAESALFLLLVVGTLTALECHAQQEAEACCCVAVHTSPELAV